MQAAVASPRAQARTFAVSAVEAAVATWRKAHPAAVVHVTVDVPGDATVPLSAGEIEAALGALLDNALHATSGRDAPIDVAVTREAGAVAVRVEDAGAGVAPHLAHRLGEPFLTTKEPGEGMGLGLYLVRTLLANVGGGLEVSPADPRGTRVTLRFAGEPG
jgi:two-component system sensor histidine kinase RegB